MSSGLQCRDCGAAIPSASPGRFCPRCLLTLGLAKAESSAADGLTERAGDRIGRYRLLQEIGRGGCGVVYRAEQEEPVRRHVALKVIKLGMDTRQVVARFEAERQALALMDHPHIARVLDAGATELGRPFFVMELVEGVRITDYCEQNRLETHERLDLFIHVCHAIQHAHQKGVIHRDIKPSNVLVASHDGASVPKVIDFGIAKAIQGRLTDQTLFTALEQFLGTPAYMSPEQAQRGDLDVDTRSDIYSLGVLLYELLIGRTPFEARDLLGGGLESMRHTIREIEPPKPSARLAQDIAEREVASRTSPPGGLRPNPVAGDCAASRRRLEEVIPLLRGDLDWIVMKCLEKERARRYETPDALAADIERHRNHEPIVARPPSRAYRIRKFAQRNKLLVATTGLIVVTLALGVGGVMWQWQRAEHHADREHAEHQRAQSAITHMEAVEVRRAEEYFEADDRRNMLPCLALVLRQNPSNRIAAERLMSTLSHRNWARLACPPLTHSNRVTFAMYTQDGSRVVTASADHNAWVWESSTGRRLVGPLTHAAEINTAAFSPDGRLVVTASQDKTARVWSAQTGAAVGDPLIHDGDVTTAQFSPDGKLILTTRGPLAQLWSVSTGQRGGAPFEAGLFVLDACFSPDGSRVALGGAKGQVTLWDVNSGVCLRRLTNAFDAWTVAFSPDGRQLLSGSSDNTARVWDVETGQPAGPPLRHEDRLWMAGFSPDGERVATASADSTAQVWDVRTGQRVGAALKHRATVRSARFSPGGRNVVTASRDKTARVWDASSGVPVTEPMAHDATAFGADFFPDGHRVLTASNGKEALIWATHAGLPLHLHLCASPGCAAFDPEGRAIIVPSGQPGVRIWSVVTGGPTTTLDDDRFGVPAGDGVAEFSPDGRLVAAATDRGGVGVWDARSGQRLTPTRMFHADRVVTARFSHDGRRLVTASWDRTARVWNALNGEPLTSPLAHGGRLTDAEFSPDDRHVLTAAADASARLWDVERSRLVREFRHKGEVHSARFSRDGERVVTASSDMSARIWDLRTGSQIGLLLHPNQVRSARFSPDGQRVVTTCGASDFRLQLWDAVTFKPLTELFGDGIAAEFSPDGDRVISGGNRSGDVRIWDGRTGERLSERLQAGPINQFSRLSQDGRFLLVGSGRDLQLWEAPPASLPVPEWLPRLAEALAGQHFDPDGRLTTVPPRELWAAQQELATWASAQRATNAFWVRWAAWFLADEPGRAIGPSAPVTPPE